MVALVVACAGLAATTPASARSRPPHPSPRATPTNAPADPSPPPSPSPSSSPSQATAPAAFGKVTIDPPSGPPGTAITVDGSQLYRNMHLTVVWDSREHPLASVATDPAGTFRNVLAAPDDSPGNHSICLAELPAVPCDVFNLGPRPPPVSLKITPTQVEPGGQVTLVGENFQPGQSLTLTFGEDAKRLAVAVADYRGAFEARVVVPKVPPRSYQVCARADAGQPRACVGVGLLTATVPMRSASSPGALLAILVAAVVALVALAATVGGRRVRAAWAQRRSDVSPDSISVEHRVGPPVLRSTHREWWDDEPRQRQRPEPGG
jgi:hypothetical protein